MPKGLRVQVPPRARFLIRLRYLLGNAVRAEITEKGNWPEDGSQAVTRHAAVRRRTLREIGVHPTLPAETALRFVVHNHFGLGLTHFELGVCFFDLRSVLFQLGCERLYLLLLLRNSCLQLLDLEVEH